jgi:hypothetical protein
MLNFSGTRQGRVQYCHIRRRRFRQDHLSPVFMRLHPPDERIVTVEDTFELNLEGHVVPLQGSKKVSIEELMKNTLRMNPSA